MRKFRVLTCVDPRGDAVASYQEVDLMCPASVVTDVWNWLQGLIQLGEVQNFTLLDDGYGGGGSGVHE